jgi:beta-1,4-mannosyl-glycoprotein beta-1,4-N-acetylglucosaminyltransferase
LLKQYPTFCRDYLQKEFIKFGLIDCDDDDIIMISDLDEIPNPNIVNEIKEKKLYDHCILQDCFYYHINTIIIIMLLLVSLALREGPFNW